MNELVKIHSYYIYSLAAFTKVFYQGIDKVSEGVQNKDVRTGELLTKSTHSPSAEGDEGVGDDEAGLMVDSVGDTPANDGEDDEGDMGTGNPVEMTDEELASRCHVLVDGVTTTVFNYVRRGLFERDKLTVASMLALKILVNDNVLTQEEVDYLVMSKTMGSHYVVQRPFDMAQTYDETSPATPMFFVLFPGVDPTPWVENLARTLGITTENGSRRRVDGFYSRTAT